MLTLPLTVEKQRFTGIPGSNHERLNLSKSEHRGTEELPTKFGTSQGIVCFGPPCRDGNPTALSLLWSYLIVSDTHKPHTSESMLGQFEHTDSKCIKCLSTNVPSHAIQMVVQL